MYDGMINVYKERGFTSHDVVAKLRGILHQKKIGHTGTLDPDAEGVLPVCLGKGTKLCDMITDHDKTYDAEMVLGVTTDTQDISGTVLCRRDVHVTDSQVSDVIASFIGPYMQIPPMYSAIKIDGRKLYEIARQGKVIERPARPVVILSVSDISIDLPYVKMKVCCSKGTYIRTLCHDIGEKLGCGACMTKLVRSAVGSFAIGDARTLAQIEKAVREEPDHIGGLLIPVETMLGDMPKLQTIDAAADKLLRNGNILQENQVRHIGDPTDPDVHIPENGRSYRMYGMDGAFLAVYSWIEEQQCLKSKKMFI